MNAMIQPVRKSQRKLRTPEHPFYVNVGPMVLSPFHIQPVLPGETMTNLLWQFRGLTQPLRSQIVGWWMEVYFFYVKLSQLDSPTSFIGAIGDDTQAGMVLNPTYDPTGLAAGAASTTNYIEDTASIDYVKRCRDVVVRHYFRDEGEDETTTAGLYGGTAALPMVHMKKPGWMDSIIATNDIPTAPDLPDDAANATMRELERLQQQWEMINALGLTNMTYEDFVKQFGVSLPDGRAADRPELLRYERYWQLPGTAALGGTADAPTISSVISWKAEGRADKDRLFKEHGFIVGYMVARPKMYLGTQRTTAVSMLDNAFAWAPRMFDDQWAGITIKDFADGRGPLFDTEGGTLDGYTADVKDLFLYGDQFLGRNIQSTNTDIPYWTLTGANSLHPDGKYCAVADIEALMADTSSPDVSVRVDGIVRASIKTHLVDSSPQNMGRVIL